MNKLMYLIISAAIVFWAAEARAEDEGMQSGHPKEAAVGNERVVSLSEGANMTFVWIEPGAFHMGSPPSESNRLTSAFGFGSGRAEDEGPVHEVAISTGFWLGKYEVTQRQWEAVMGITPWQDNGKDKDLVRSVPSHPAVHISWSDVQAFIDRLNSTEGEEVYRLPTEAEWEYACRAGTSTRYSFGDDEDQLIDYAWTRKNSWTKNEKYAHAIGQHRPNLWGIHDMHGNVWEWVRDWYAEDYYTQSPKVDPSGPLAGSDRVIRGGDFSDPFYYLRSASRSKKSPDMRDSFIGVRLVRIR